MNSYIDYEYYINTFGGSLVPQSDFEKYSVRASNEVRIRIFNRDITQYEDLVKTSTCSIMELIYNQELIKQRYMLVAQGVDTIVTSEKVGDYSRNIATTTPNELKELCSNETTDKLISNELEKNLLFTGLLSRNIYVR